MVAMTQTARPLREALRMIRETIRHLTSVASTAEPAPYWTDYLRDSRDRSH